MVLNVCKRNTCKGTAVGFCTQDADPNHTSPFSGQRGEVPHVLPGHYKFKMKRAAGALPQVSVSRVSPGHLHVWQAPVGGQTMTRLKVGTEEG